MTSSSILRNLCHVTCAALMQYEHIMQRLAERDRNVTSLAVRLTSVDDSYDVLRLTDSETDNRAFVLALVSQQALHSLLTQVTTNVASKSPTTHTISQLIRASHLS